MLSRRKLVVGGAAAITPAHTVSAHGVHAAFTIIEQNARAGTLEIIHRLMVLDLELALTARTGQRIRMEEAVNQEGDALISDYVGEYFSLATSNQDTLPLTWIGMELNADTLFTYQETALPETLTDLVVTNQILTEAHPSQVNTVNVTFGGRTQSRLFVLGDPPQRFSLT